MPDFRVCGNTSFLNTLQNKEFQMKNKCKLHEIIAFLAIIGSIVLSLTGCPTSDNDGGREKTSLVL